jgi:NTE family protein
VAKRALVLSGGGPVGIAWETGVAAGLAERGIDLRDADLIIGTSAGSVVGAQLALGRAPAEMLAGQLARRDREGGPAGREGERPSAPDLSGLMQVMARAWQADRPLEERLREVGAFALAAKTGDEEAFVAGFRGGIGDAWPEKDFRCTAIDALTGRFVVWDRSSGVPLVRAVASSCAVPGIFPPVTIDGRRYYDGGIRSASNADLAAGAEIVLIISVGGGEGSDDPRALLARQRLVAEIATLLEAGAKAVELITPDSESRGAFGMNLMDSRQNPRAAESGLRQGRAEAERLRRIWG